MRSSLWKTAGILLLVVFAGALATPASAKKHGRKHGKHGAAHHAAKHRKPNHHAQS